jgi:hypothetical protein
MGIKVVEVKFKLNVDVDKDESYPDYIKEMTDLNQKALAMVDFDDDNDAIDWNEMESDSYDVLEDTDEV